MKLKQRHLITDIYIYIPCQGIGCRPTQHCVLGTNPNVYIIHAQKEVTAELRRTRQCQCSKILSSALISPIELRTIFHPPPPFQHPPYARRIYQHPTRYIYISWTNTSKRATQLFNCQQYQRKPARPVLSAVYNIRIISSVSSEIALPDWIQDELREVLIYEVIKTYMTQLLNRYSWSFSGTSAATTFSTTMEVQVAWSPHASRSNQGRIAHIYIDTSMAPHEFLVSGFSTTLPGLAYTTNAVLTSSR